MAHPDGELQSAGEGNLLRFDEVDGVVQEDRVLGIEVSEVDLPEPQGEGDGQNNEGIQQPGTAVEGSDHALGMVAEPGGRLEGPGYNPRRLRPRRPKWRNGRRGGLKNRWGQPRAGSNPAFGTKLVA